MSDTTSELAASFRGLNVAVTGVAGTVGAELLRQLALVDVESIVGLDSNESELFFVGQEYRSDARVSIGLADVRDRASLESAFAGSDIVFHAAALKHVPLCEAAPL